MSPDAYVETTGRHGGDIASQRLDALDAEALTFLLQRPDRTGVAVDLGCGLGMQGLRFAALGFRTLLIDQLPAERTVARISGLHELLPFSYLQQDIRGLNASELQPDIILCSAQRCIHYLRFPEAVALLRTVRSCMRPDARLFLSASGLASELGVGYGPAQVPLAERFGVLSPAMAERHGIHEPVCLYSPEDLVTLCADASFTVERVWVSPFGNVKGIFSPATS